jgi:hypothetical protein
MPDDVRRLLDLPSTAHLASLMPDGAPHSVPLWIGVEGEQVAFLTSPDSQGKEHRRRSARRDLPHQPENPHDMAHLRGRVARRVHGDEAWTIIDRLSDKYTGMPYPLRTDRVVYLVEVDHAGAATFG